jgi:periplasmic protein CpxP/Spy
LIFNVLNHPNVIGKIYFHFIMEKTKLLTIAVIGLLLLNLGTLGFLFFSKKPMGDRGGNNVQIKALNFLMTEVQYDEAQKQECNRILQTHRANMDKVHGEIRAQHNRLFENLASGDTSAVVVIGQLHQQSESEIFRYFTALRNVARPDQKPKFDRILDEAMRIMPPPK